MRVFIGGALDVKSEMARLQSSFAKLRPAIEIIVGEKAEIVDWSALSPADGKAQQTIFDQARFADTDVFVFVFWHKFGTRPGVGFSDWRSRRALGDSLPPGTMIAKDQQLPYESGTEAEIEYALAAIKLRKDQIPFDLRPKRVMVYRCTRDVPQTEIDHKQWEMLSDYFSARLSKELLFYNFVTEAELESAFYGHMISTALSLSSLERRAYASLTALRQEYLASERDKSKANIVQQYIAAECESASNIVSSMDGQQRRACRLRTTDLYDRILQMIRKATEVKIVDLDFRRWNELLEPNDRLYTLNYSREIMNASAERARRLSGFTLKRVFAVQKRVLRDDMLADRLLKILEKIQKRLSDEQDVASRIQIRIFVDSFRHTQTMHTNQKLMNGVSHFSRARFYGLVDRMRRNQDFVLCRTSVGANGDATSDREADIILREDLSFDAPKSAFETWGSISAQPDDISEVTDCFDELWCWSLDLQDAICVLSDRMANRLPHSSREGGATA